MKEELILHYYLKLSKTKVKSFQILKIRVYPIEVIKIHLLLFYCFTHRQPVTLRVFFPFATPRTYLIYKKIIKSLSYGLCIH